MNPEIAAILTRDGVVTARRNPHLARALNSCAYRGEVVRLLPGVFAHPDRVDHHTLLRAACAYGDSLVITRRSAARSWWPEIDGGAVIDVASPTEIKTGTGFRFEQRYLRPELVMRSLGLLTTTPEVTVLDLIDDLGATAIDEALRRRAVTLADLQRALRLTPGRRGNQHRRDLLEDSRDEPWSQLEREAHRLLRADRILGWRTNYRVNTDVGTYLLDIAFTSLRLGIELDGARYHDTDDAFHLDRKRDRALGRAGWHILRFTAEGLDDLVETVRTVSVHRRTLLGRLSA